MALTANQNLVTFERLSEYDVLIKEYIGTEDAKSIKSISYDSSTRVVSFFKTEDGTGTAAYTVTLPDTSNFIEKFAMSGAGAATEGDFVTIAADGTLTDAGSTIAAEKITIEDSGSLITATNVEDALQELASASAGGVSSKTVYIVETAGGSGDAFSKRYGIYQGATGSSASPVAGEKLTDIDIPKDMVVESGSVVDIVFDSSDNTLHEGSISGTDVTTAIKGSTTPTAADAGKYIKLVIANSSSTALYIKATDLVDIYTAEQNATQIQLAIDSNNVISATVVAGSIGATELDTDAVTTAKIADENVTLGKLSSGVQTSLGLADTAIQPADMTASNILYTEGTGGAADIMVDDALDDIYTVLNGISTDIDTAIDNKIADLDSSTDDVGVTSTEGESLNVLTSVTIADGLISAKGYTPLAFATTAQIQGLFS